MAHEDLTANTMHDVHGIGFQARDVHGDVYLTSTPRPAPPPPCDPPAGWASTTGLPPEVQELLDAQAHAAEELPYQLPHARRPALGTVYVRQDVGSGVEDGSADPPRPTPMLDQHGQLIDMTPPPVVRVAVRPPSKPMRVALDGDDHLVVTGGPGQGKSTLTLQLTADIVRQWRTKSEDDAPLEEPVLPLRLPARVLAAHLGPSFAKALADSAAAEYGHLMTGQLDAALMAGRVAGCRWLLLVDALDEVVDGEARAKIVQALSAWASKATYRILLTTRPTERGALASLQRAGATRYELQPFDDESLRLFAMHWFEEEGEDCAQRFLRQIREAQLFELVEVPLLATIAAIVFEQSGQEPLPSNQYELYDSYLAHIRKSRPTPETFERWRIALVEHLGRTRLETDTSLAAAVHIWAKEHPDAGTGDELIAHLQASGPFVQRGKELTFLHHSFAEHVAATAAARDLPEEFDPDHPAFAELLHKAQLLEPGRFARAVLLHHTRLHPAQADRLLGWLRKGKSSQHLLASRLLAKHLAASGPRIDEFLEVVHGWAMTTQYPARRILSETSRATHHPGLADWLVALMHDEAAPLESRAEAATALSARLRDPRTGEALALLRVVIDDQSAPVAHRLIAAEALAHSGSSEREGAERGLHSVLDDPFAAGADCRSAAVVLAAFGGAAREFAVKALDKLVSDVDTPMEDLVQAATGLVEIDVEFHDRCVEVFLTVLRDPVHSLAGRRDAALGLASLGAQEAAAEAITKVARDSRLLAGNRAGAAEMLALLGGRQRVAAGDLLREQLDAFDTPPKDRWEYPAPLVRVGHRDHAVEFMRRVLADRSTPWNGVVSIATALGSLGPAFHDEAASHLERAHQFSPRVRYGFVGPLSALADLAEPHRSSAIARLRSALTDLSLDSETRSAVASELIRCAPEHHSAAAEQLMAIVRDEREPKARSSAWAQLRRLGPAHAEKAREEVLLLARDHSVVTDVGTAFSGASADQRRRAADVLVAVIRDGEQDLRVRLPAVRALISLGKVFHRAALEEVLELVRAGLVVDVAFVATYFTSSGRGVRADFVAELYEVLQAAILQPDYAWSVIEALDALGHQPPRPVLLRLVEDEAADLMVRAEAAVVLAKADPAQVDLATDLVIDASTVMPFLRWRQLIGELGHLGVDVSTRLRTVVADPDTLRIKAMDPACLIEPQYLLSHVRGTYSEFGFLKNICYLLAECGEHEVAVTQYRSVLNDPDELITNKCDAAAELARLDQTFWPQACEMAWRLSESRCLTAAERHATAAALACLEASESSRFTSFAVSLAHDPEVSFEDVASLAKLVARQGRTEIERLLLEKPEVPVVHRLPERDLWEDVPLRVAAEGVIREILSAPEYAAGERRAAMIGLSRLSASQTAKAVELLLAEGSSHALRKAAELGAWRRVHDHLQDVVVNEALSMRERRRAALLIGRIAHKPSVLDFLRSDLHASWRDRVDELWYVSDCVQLRSIRDNRALPPHQRWRALRYLIYRSVEDQAVCARVLAEMAADAAVRPPMRWWSADALADMGARGRAEALPLLKRLAHDASVPVIVRNDAAATIGRNWRSMRPQMLDLHRDLLPAAKPLARVQVFSAIGMWSVTEAVEGLNVMAADIQLGPVVRLWAANVMLDLRRDMRERCAVVARDVAFDDSVPWHVRRRAARYLARWSELMREDARALLGRLRDCQAR